MDLALARQQDQATEETMSRFKMAFPRLCVGFAMSMRVYPAVIER